jgi:hypothetical protein
MGAVSNTSAVLSPNSRVLTATLPLQVFDQTNLITSLDSTKEKMAKNAILESKARKPTDLTKSRAQSAKNAIHKSNSRKQGSEIENNGEDDDDLDVPMDNGEVFYSFSYNNNDNVVSRVGGMGSTTTKSTNKPLDKQRVKSAKARYVPEKADEFRREFSADHPLAGGMGHYKVEQTAGLKPASGARTEKEMTIETLVRPPREKLESKYFDDSGLEELSEKAFEEVENLKRRQNEYVLSVLEEERAAEEYREQCLASFNGKQNQKMSGHEELIERKKLESIFTEQRQRASARILQLTKEHEANIKQLVLSHLLRENKR